MTRLETLEAELVHEAKTARKHLERLPQERFDWRPHPKSYTAGGLAAHIVECIRWVEPIFLTDQLEFDPATYRSFEAATVAAVLEGLDAKVERARQALAKTADREATGPWRLMVRGKVWFEKPREAAFRDMTLNHLVHHRGQFSVYLRLLDIPVPASYGPTADER